MDAFAANGLEPACPTRVRGEPPRCRRWHRWGGAQRYRTVFWSRVRRIVFLAEADARATDAAQCAHALGLRNAVLALNGHAGTAASLERGDLLIGFTPAACARAARTLARVASVQIALLDFGGDSGLGDGGSAGIAAALRALPVSARTRRSA